MTAWFRMSVVCACLLLQSGCLHPMTDAVRKGDVQAVQALIDRGPDRKATAQVALFDAARVGNLAIAQLALDRGADIEVEDDREDCTALFWAAMMGQVQVVQFLLDHGADVHKRNSFYGGTPLHFAALSGHTQVVQLLLERGAIVDENMLLHPREKGWTTIVRLLEEAQARQAGLAKPLTPSPATSFTALESIGRVILSSDVDRVPALQISKKKNAYAVVIGIEQYREQLPKANFAAHDASVVGDYLTKALGYPEENVVVRLNEKATKTDLEKYFEAWLPNNVEKDSSVFVYFSGHGAPHVKTGDAYLVPYDGDPTFVDKTGFSLKRLYTALDKLPAKDVTVVLDSCFSGAGGRSVLAEGARPMGLSMEIQALTTGRITVLSASAGDQISNTFKEQGHGLLTYFFLKGLQGEGDANKDGAVEMAELYDYVKPNVQKVARKQYNNEQTPQLLASPDVLKRGGGRLLERTRP